MNKRTQLLAFPPAPAGGDGPVVLLMHGYGADERDLVPLTGAFPPGFRWVSLRAPLALPQGGRAWFPIEGIPLPADIVLPEAAVGEAVEAVRGWIDANIPAGEPIVLLGFSQGGFMATQLLRAWPERFAGAVVLSGFVAPGAQPGDERLRELRPPLLFTYGEEDPIIGREAFGLAERVLSDLGKLQIERRRDLGHGIDPAQLDAIRAFLQQVQSKNMKNEKGAE